MKSDIPSNDNDSKINLLTLSSAISIPESVTADIREPLLYDEDNIPYKK